MDHNNNPIDASKHAIEAVAAEAGKHLDDFIHKMEQPIPVDKVLSALGGDILGFAGNLIGTVEKEVKIVTSFVGDHAGKIGNLLAHIEQNDIFWNWGRFKTVTWGSLSGEVNQLGKDFIEWFIAQSLGVDLGESTGGKITQQFTSTVGGTSVTTEKTVDATEAIGTLNHLSSFLIELPFLTAAINMVGGLMLGERWKETGGEYLSKFTEELGLSWMTGTLLEQVFEQAVGRELEELINVQKHPNRLDMMTLRTLARQHKIDPVDFEWELSKLGFPAELRTLILKLDTNQLPIGDVANAWIMGYKDKEWVKEYLKGQGYSDDDADVLMFSYITHASTQAESVYRDTARMLYSENKIAEPQFRHILQLAQTPDRSIDIEVATVKLQHDYGRKSLTISEIKKAWDSGQFHDPEAKTHLIDYGYSEDDAGTLIEEWKQTTTLKPRMLSASQILRYMVSGHIDPISAYQKLIELRYRPEDAAFLISNPTAQIGNRVQPLSRASVIAAYEDGINDQSTTRSLLQQLNVDNTEINLLIQISNYKIARKKKTSVPPKLLGNAEIKAAFKVGMIYQPEVQEKLEDIGYSKDDAHFVSMTWWYEENPTPLGKGLPPGVVPPAIWQPGPTSPPAPVGNFVVVYLVINLKLYRTYPQLFNPVQPLNSTAYEDSNHNQYYILEGDDIPPGFTVVGSGGGGGGNPPGPG